MIRRCLAIAFIAGALCAGAASAQSVTLQERHAAKQANRPEKQSNPPAQPVAPQQPAQSAAYHADCRNPVDHDAADWCEQKRAADGAARAAQAAVDAVNVARNQNLLLWITLLFSGAAVWAGFRAANAAHKTLVGLERPYIVVEPTTTLAMGGALHTGFAIFNHGRSPATLRSVSLGGIDAIHEWQAFVRARYTVNLKDISIFLADVNKPHRDIKEIAIARMPVGTPADVVSKAKTYIMGRVVYDSVLGARYVRFFCWEYRGKDDLKQVGGGALNGDRKVGRLLEDAAHWLGKMMGRYAPSIMEGPFGEFTRKQAEKERERHDRPDARR
jgi:hypothetical protein